MYFKKIQKYAKNNNAFYSIVLNDEVIGSYFMEDDSVYFLKTELYAEDLKNILKNIDFLKGKS